MSEESFDGVHVLLYVPERAKNETVPGILHIHGGGWSIMSSGTEYFNELFLQYKLEFLTIINNSFMELKILI